MLENDDLEGLTKEEKLQAENDLLKIKLEMEFGMKGMGLSPDMNEGAQNDFLNYIYNWEKQFADRKTIKVYDRIGQPKFKKITELSIDEITIELDRLYKILRENGIGFNTIFEYDGNIIYKFITEELFDEEMNDIRIDGMMTNFTYEEFHPNHDHDIQQQVNEFFENMITHKWNDFISSILLADSIIFNDKTFEKKAFLEIVNAFQEHHERMELIHWEITELVYNLETELAHLKGTIKYKSFNEDEIFMGDVYFEFLLDYNYWVISKLVLPGFGN